MRVPESGDGFPLPMVLVVEDDRDTRELYKIVFEGEGFCVAEAAEADAGLAAAAHLQPRVIVTDLSLLGAGDGSTLARALARLQTTAHIPVIAVTGWSRPKVPGYLFVDVLQKPVAPDVLVAAVRRVLATTAVVRNNAFRV